MNLERIATLLASGLKPTNVATIVGCSPARISQLAKDSIEFQNLLAVKEAEAQTEDIEEAALSSKYHAAEHLLLNQIMDMAPVSELRDVTNALRVVADRQDKAKTRLNPIQGSQSVIQQVIQINIPAHALPEVTLTREKEVISVNQTNLAPLTSAGVTNLFSQMKKEKENEPRRIQEETEGTPQESVSEVPEELVEFIEAAHG